MANPTWQALVPRIVGEREVGPAIGATQALATLAAVAGAPLGGLLSGLGGQRLPLLADAVASSCSPWPRCWCGPAEPDVAMR